MNEIIGIRLQESAGWHALITKAQVIVDIRLPEIVETYVSRLVYRNMTSQSISHANLVLLESTTRGSCEELQLMADQCLIVAGLMPEQAIRDAIPVSYFVEMARRGYFELGRQIDEAFYTLLGDHVVDCVDVLQTLREIDAGESCIDPLCAYEMWRDTGSTRAWSYLADMTSSTPYSASSEVQH